MHHKDSRAEFLVSDLSLWRWGRKEILLAEKEMPGLMQLRDEYKDSQPLAGIRVAGSLHLTIQTAVLIETLADLGATIRWCSCNIFSTQDHAAAALAVGPTGSSEQPRGIPVFGWKGETVEEYWRLLARTLDFGQGLGPQQIVDDGGDATLLIHAGAEFEDRGGPPPPSKGSSADEAAMFAVLADRFSVDCRHWNSIAGQIRGVTEETTTGVRRLQSRQANGSLLFPAVNINDSVTKSKFDNLYGCRHSLIDGLMRASDIMISGKVCVVCGYGDVGKGCCQSLRGQGGKVIVTEIDPICALQASMEGFEVQRLEDVVHKGDIFITATGNRGVIIPRDMEKMKDGAIIGNIGHFDNEIDMVGLASTEGIDRTEIKPQYDRWTFQDGHWVMILAEGRLLNLGCATGHPSFVMSNSFSNQVIAQIELARNESFQTKKVHQLPKILDEKVARLHLGALGAQLTELSEEQAKYIGVSRNGPFKPDYYRY